MAKLEAKAIRLPTPNEVRRSARRNACALAHLPEATMINPVSRIASVEQRHPIEPVYKAATSGSAWPRTRRFEWNRTLSKPWQGRSIRAIALTILVTMGCTSISEKATAGDTRSSPSAYCIQLAKQFDRTLLNASPSRFLVEAKIRRENGWAQCKSGKTGQGENTLQSAIRDLGGTPESRARVTAN